MTHQHYDFENLSISDFSAQDLLQIFVSMVTLSTVDPEIQLELSCTFSADKKSDNGSKQHTFV
jgi:hypothetical protein